MWSCGRHAPRRRMRDGGNDASRTRLPERPQKMTTAVADDFEWHTGPPGRVLRCRALDVVAPHLFTTRERSFRGPTEAVDYRDLERAFDVAAGALVRVRQVHGRSVLVVRPGEAIAERLEADAI